LYCSTEYNAKLWQFDKYNHSLASFGTLLNVQGVRTGGVESNKFKKMLQLNFTQVTTSFDMGTLKAISIFAK